MSSRQQIFEIHRFVRRAIERYWKLGALVTCIAVGLALVGTLLMPRSYYSEARLFVRFGRENQVDPTASGGQMVSLYESRESEINSLIEILKSRAIIDRVVEELGPEAVLYGRGQGARDSSQGNSQLASKSHQLAVGRLAKTVFIAAPRKSNIITVTCKANSPALAQRIVAKLVEVYRDEHVRVHRSPGTYAFFEEQARQSLDAWEEAAEALRTTKDRLGIVTIEGRRKRLDDTQTDLHFKQLANEADAKTTRARIMALEAEIAKLSPTLITQETTGASAAADGMRQTLYGLEAQEQELAAKMQDGHPRLVAIRQQVADLRDILDDQPAERRQATEAINPTRQTLELSLLNERSRAESLTATGKALGKQLDQARIEMIELNASAIAIDELTQRVALAESNHKEYSQRLEQARINRTLDDERLSSLSLVQPASYIATPTGPRRLYVLAVGMLLALTSGTGAILVAAWLNPVIETTHQLVELLGIPLIGSIPSGGFAATAA